VLYALVEAGVPVAIVMAGGYAEDLDDVVDIHLATIDAALERFAGAPSATVAPVACRAAIP
jgi:hypothetical protein